MTLYRCQHDDDLKYTLDDGDVYCLPCDRLASEGPLPEPEQPAPSMWDAVRDVRTNWEGDHYVPTVNIAPDPGPLRFAIRVEQEGQDPLYIRHEIVDGKLSAVHTSKDSNFWSAPHLDRVRRLERALLSSFEEGEKNLETILDALAPEEEPDEASDDSA